uniref:Uncharacterized protein n=1 Tax=Triticum urartu TaxID=4572 RepID=A0A8R7Q4Z5_TRIUA
MAPTICPSEDLGSLDSSLTDRAGQESKGIPNTKTVKDEKDLDGVVKNCDRHGQVAAEACALKSGRSC